MIELRHPGGKTHRAVGWFNFLAALGCCTSASNDQETAGKDTVEMTDRKGEV
jgi:hypothetical protein